MQGTDENKDPEKSIGMDREKFGQLILGRVIYIAATRCHILRLKCTEFGFGWDSAPDPAAGGPYSAPPNPVAGF